MEDTRAPKNKSPDSQPSPTTSFAVAFVLTWIAGFVDAVGFLTFARIYTANMSGNSVAVGIAIGHQQWMTLLFRFWPILFYVGALILGRFLIQIGSRLGIRRIASAAFGCEVLTLGTVCLWGGARNLLSPAESQYAGVALLAVAMGIQNAVLTHFGSLTLHSGFVTGTLVKFAEEFVAYATWLWETVHSHKELSKIASLSIRHRSFRLSLFFALNWTAYVVGAFSGAWRQHSANVKALTIPLIGLLLLIAVDLYMPLAIQDEQEQARSY